MTTDISRTSVIAKVMLTLCPALVRSSESVDQLVMRDLVDFSTGMEVSSHLNRSQESDDLGDVKKLPSVTDNVIVNTVFATSSANEKKEFDELLTQLEEKFQTAFRRRKSDIERVVKTIIEIDGADNEAAAKIMSDIKNDTVRIHETNFIFPLSK